MTFCHASVIASPSVSSSTEANRTVRRPVSAPGARGGREGVRIRAQELPLLIGRQHQAPGLVAVMNGRENAAARTRRPEIRMAHVLALDGVRHAERHASKAVGGHEPIYPMVLLSESSRTS